MVLSYMIIYDISIRIIYSISNKNEGTWSGLFIGYLGGFPAPLRGWSMFASNMCRQLSYIHIKNGVESSWKTCIYSIYIYIHIYTVIIYYLPVFSKPFLKGQVEIHQGPAQRKYLDERRMGNIPKKWSNMIKQWPNCWGWWILNNLSFIQIYGEHARYPAIRHRLFQDIYMLHHGLVSQYQTTKDDMLTRSPKTLSPDPHEFWCICDANRNHSISTVWMDFLERTGLWGNCFGEILFASRAISWYVFWILIHGLPDHVLLLRNGFLDARHALLLGK